ncbi:hypothetical protein KCU95_g111, partial [Aureobasidium melanogenum]
MRSWISSPHADGLISVVSLNSMFKIVLLVFKLDITSCKRLRFDEIPVESSKPRWIHMVQIVQWRLEELYSHRRRPSSEYGARRFVKYLRAMRWLARSHSGMSLIMTWLGLWKECW